MKNSLNKSIIERYSRQIVLKDVGVIGQKAIINSKVLIIGAGGLGCPLADYLSRAGVGTIGIADYDKVSLSNIHRQSLYGLMDVGKFKVNVLKQKIKFNPIIICSGAAISFLTKQQAPINDFYDKIYLGWLVRIIFDPRVFLSRYYKAFKLFFLVLNNNVITKN